jgi:hypothetical protein
MKELIDGWRRGGKKRGDARMACLLAMLLKTHGEKMSENGFLAMLVIIKIHTGRSSRY